VAAAVDLIRQEDDGPTVLVGWSFGAWVALRHAVTDQRIAAAALIGFPLTAALSSRRPLPSLGELEGLRIPVLLLAGDGDPFCPVTDMHNLADWIPRAETVVLDGADHFFARRERELAERVGSWIDGALGA
jgi:uncharacterized protein